MLHSLDLTRTLGVHREDWVRFGRHWDELAPDPYAAELGIERLAGTGVGRQVRPLASQEFRQPERSNPLYVGRDRVFEPLTETFAEDPLLRELLRVLGRLAAALDDDIEWDVKVHPFRTQSTGDDGYPTPEGIHRDGVTMVSSLLFTPRNALGGESTVRDTAGRQLLATTLDEPGTLLVGDDRRTVHGVSPIRPIDDSGPAQRDVLVITFASHT